MNERSQVVVVTGLSGAGKSTALHALEDLGYFCVDNLPTSVVTSTVDACESGDVRRIGLGIDMRALAFLDGAGPALERISEGRDVVILFLDASDEALLRRFNETRRPHPLSAVTSRPDGSRGGLAVLDGVHLERERLAIPLRRPNGQAAVDGELGLHGSPFTQPELANEFRGDPQGKTIAPLRYL